jgi:hypothetical protein
MRTLILFPVMAAAMLLTGCEAKAPDGASSEAGNTSSTAANAPAAGTDLLADSGWAMVKLTGVTCGDNCYVQIEPTVGGAAQEVMCTVTACNSWFEQQALPADVLGKTYQVRLGATEQVDNAGTVQDAGFPAIVEMRPAG